MHLASYLFLTLNLFLKNPLLHAQEISESNQPTKKSILQLNLIPYSITIDLPLHSILPNLHIPNLLSHKVKNTIELSSAKIILNELESINQEAFPIIPSF